MQHPLIRTPTQRLLDARRDHAKCLRLAAWHRGRLASGDASMRARHAWALGLARKLRLRFPGLLSQPRPRGGVNPPGHFRGFLGRKPSATNALAD